jgi:predicted nuclease of restriction endonuclease-like (RecB) superfamily
MNKAISKSLLADVRQLIEESRKNVARQVNSAMSVLYWQIGYRIRTEILKNKRAEYGKQVITTLARELSEKYGKGWSEQQLRHCLYTVENFPDEAVFSSLGEEFSWSHIKEFIYMGDPLKRDFYIEICKMENWSVRQLRERMQSMLFERTSISKKPEETIKKELKKLKTKEEFSSDLVFRDPYLLDFLGLADTYSEKDLENAIIAELQRFITEMGTDFAFLARQKRIVIDGRDYSIDLLFYHRRLQCLVVIDLKLGQFEAAYKGQMELYLRYLEKFDKKPGENTPIGLILCTGKNHEHIELLQLDKSNIRVADYLTALPPKKLLQQKLHKAVEIARNRFVETEKHQVEKKK